MYSLLPVEEDLSANVVHLDATIAQSFRAAKGLFAAGYSKHRRADLPQIKIMLSTFSPFGIPLCVEVVKGSSADDELYLPMIARVEQTLMKQGLLFVGDSKLGSILNRYTVHLGKNYYLTPLNRVQLPFAELQRLLVENKDKASVLNEEDAVKITAFEITQQRAQELTTWEERVIIAYSAPYNQTQTAKFDKQLNKTEAALKELAVSKQGKTQLKTVEEVQNKVDEIFKENKTTEFFDLIITPHLTEKTTRKYKDIPARTTTTTHFSLTITRKKDKIAEYKAVLGWRAYATNAPIDKLSTLKVLQTYKDEFKVEYRFNQLHNKTAPLMPIFLHKENRITALVRLLMLAIKVLGLLEYKIRKQIDLENIQINHIYPGNPARKTNKPTAEMVLRAFRNIFLAATPTDNNNFSLQVTQLLPHQQLLIRLAGFQNLIYNDISSQPNFNKNCISYNSEDAIKGKSFITSRIDSSE